MNGNQRLYRLILIALFVTLLTSACGVFGSDDDDEDVSAIIIGYSQWPGFSAVNIADHQGFFEAEGVKVQVVVFEQYTASLDSLTAGKIDAFTGSLGDVVSTTANGTPLTMVWALDTPTTAEALVGRADISGPADLKGKRVAFLPGGYGHLFVSEVLKQHGLSESDITPVEMSAEQIPLALAAGEIDAGHVWEPYVSQSVQVGAGVIFTAQDTPGLIIDGLAFRTDVVEKRPAEVRAVVRAVSKAVDFWQQNPVEGNIISAQANNITEAAIADVLAGMQIYALQDNRLVFDRGDNSTRSLYDTSRLYIDFFLAQGSINQSPDLNKLINPSFVQG